METSKRFSTGALKNPLVKGTLILTLAGLITRLIGFILKIFLSRVIGAEGIGIYQLSFSAFIILHSVISTGMETAVSKCVAAVYARNPDDPVKAKSILVSALIYCLALGIPLSALVYAGSDFLAQNLLNEAACAPVVRLFCIAAPISCLHGCFCNYYYGQKKTIVPAVSSLIEQSARIVATLICYYVLVISNTSAEGSGLMSADAAVVAIIFGELITVCFMVIRTGHCLNRPILKEALSSQVFLPLFRLSVPMTINRLLITSLSSLEAVAIPMYLQLYGLSSSQSLSLYGILTGMAMPFIMFPTAVINALCVMLLPTVSGAQAQNHMDRVRTASKANLIFCFTFGCGASLLFFFSGSWLGTTFYNNSEAGSYISLLSFICPFLYCSMTLTGILNGLGATVKTLRNNILSMLLRLAFILIGIPKWGIKAYLVGLMVTSVMLCALHLLTLRKELRN